MLHVLARLALRGNLNFELRTSNFEPRKWPVFSGLQLEVRSFQFEVPAATAGRSWRYRLGVRTRGSQPRDRGSNPRTATKFRRGAFVPAALPLHAHSLRLASYGKALRQVALRSRGSLAMLARIIRSLQPSPIARPARGFGLSTVAPKARRWIGRPRHASARQGCHAIRRGLHHANAMVAVSVTDSHPTTGIVSPGCASERSSSITAISSATTTDPTATTGQTARHTRSCAPTNRAARVHGAHDPRAKLAGWLDWALVAQRVVNLGWIHVEVSPSHGTFSRDNRLFRSARPRCRRALTVPAGTPSTLAASVTFWSRK